MITIPSLYFWLAVALFLFLTAFLAFSALNARRRALRLDKEVRKLKYDMGIKSVDLLFRIEKLTEENQHLSDIQNKELSPSSIVEKKKDFL